MAQDNVIDIRVTAKDEASRILDSTKRNINDFSNAVPPGTQALKRFGGAAASASLKAITGVTGIASAWGTAQIADIVGGATDAYRDFEQTLSDVSTLIEGDSTEQIDQLRRGINDLIKVVPKTAEELGATSYDIMSAGVSDVNDQLAVLEQSAKLATAGLGDTKGAADLITSSVNAFGLSAQDADKVANVIFETVKNGKTTVDELAQSFGATAPTIAAAGLSLEDFQAATAALTTTGLPASVAQTQLRQAIVSLTKPTKELEILYKRMGTKGLPDLIAEGKTMGDIFTDLTNAAGGNQEMLARALGSVEAYNAVISLSGDQNVAYKNTLTSLTDETQLMKEAFDKQAGSASSLAQIQENELAESQRKIGETLEPLNQKLGDLKLQLSEGLVAVIPTVVQVLNDGIDTLDDFTTSLTNVGKALGFIDDGIVDLSTTQMVEVFDTMKNFGIDPNAIPPELKERMDEIQRSTEDADLAVEQIKNQIEFFADSPGWEISQENARVLEQILAENEIKMEDLDEVTKTTLKNIDQSADAPIKKMHDMKAAVDNVAGGIRNTKNEWKDLLRSISTEGAANVASFGLKAVPKFAEGGEFVTRGPQLIMVGDNPGGREQVEITPLGGGPNNTTNNNKNMTINNTFINQSNPQAFAQMAAFQLGFIN